MVKKKDLGPMSYLEKLDEGRDQARREIPVRILRVLDSYNGELSYKRLAEQYLGANPTTEDVEVYLINLESMVDEELIELKLMDDTTTINVEDVGVVTTDLGKQVLYRVIPKI
jgi:hypothetical protein